MSKEEANATRCRQLDTSGDGLSELDAEARESFIPTFIVHRDKRICTKCGSPRLELIFPNRTGQAAPAEILGLYFLNFCFCIRL